MNSIQHGLDGFNYAQAVLWHDWLETGDIACLRQAILNHNEEILVFYDLEKDIRSATSIVALEDYLHEFAEQCFGEGDRHIFEHMGRRIDQLGLALAIEFKCFDEWLQIHVRDGLSGVTDE